ncbi:glycosyltransferase family 2 protein [Aliiglaciecola sp. 3_MG-2023]|uniref:glycosyltransferase family 2 protein n=1 Tax=Aliiglaciecola sp. 3_MG-2023 TaxID=3062644 RepID=UPI0026E3EACD|nr:glycosyltransferase family 2 protein [Aliiglaciecola sp. 3_MG-2023]MDO6693010.1 glycosyltransferase family 2 protein [Aliiglaciecola sp. 3_MG-2023]
MTRRKISCFMIVCNEADRIEASLAPLAGWVDQLVVLDSGSTDGTVELAKKYTDSVYQTDWPGFGAQRNRALTYCEHDWVLNIDADEVITAELKQEIDDVLSEPNLDATFIKFPWHTFLFGKTLKHGRYASPQGKLFLKEGANFKHRSVHESLEMPVENVRILKSPLLHYSWRDYYHVQEKHLKYAVLGAGDKAKKNKKSSLSFAVLRFFVDFLQQYLFRLGFLDGKRGFLMAVILGQYGFHKYAALWALNQENGSAEEDK